MTDMLGCTNPGADNYNPAADQEDYSCLYLIKREGDCHLFKDVAPVEISDESFTLSYSIAGESWVFFHDYFADFYTHSREHLYSLKNDVFFKHHEGAPGVYYDAAIKPFFIDVIFRAEGDLLLETVTWVTEFLNNNDTDSTFSTLTHISIWNSTQHSGRIALTQLLNDLRFVNTRRTKGEWNLNTFRDILQDNAGDFLQNIFENYALDSSKVDNNKSWYKQLVMQDKWFCIRFEFDNSVNGKLVIHDTTIQALKQDR